VSHVRAVELAVSSGAFYPHVATEDVPAAAARLGIRTVEIMLQTAGEYQPEFIAQLAANARNAGVRIHSLHTVESLHRMMGPYPRRTEEGRVLFQQGIDAAAALEAQVIVWHGPNRHEVATDAQWEKFLQVTRELAQACGSAGITLGLENVSRCALSQVRHVVNFAKHLGGIGSPREVGFVFDPFQAAEAGANPFMMLAAMGNRVVDVHISDYREDDRSVRHLPPGDGDLPWPALIRAIAGSGYSGPMMIEGPLGDDDIVLSRIRESLTPLIRSVFPFSPDEHRHDDARVETLPDGVLKGIALFNERKFYEQHEVIEHEWHAERGPIRRLYQGILQIGVGFHHALNGNHRGATSLLTDGIAKTSDFLPEVRGINTQALVSGAQACLDEILALGPDRLDAFDASRIPLIETNRT
jgi:sugar phosphate isomerase/epimerase/predicted metal-dependent hydrolase